MENTIDFSAVNSMDKANEMAAQGQLVKTPMTPLRFGAPDTPLNNMYITQAAADQKDAVDNAIGEQIAQGKKLTYEVQLENAGNSFVPKSFTVKTTGDYESEQKINVW